MDRAVEVGLDFVHFNGMSGEFFYHEIFPPGVGLFDYDNDGDLDAFIYRKIKISFLMRLGKNRQASASM